MAISTEQNQIYVVENGDSLWDIARRFNTTVDTLKTINNLDSDELQIGMNLIVQTDSKSDVPNENIKYTVKQGDSLWAIANRYSVSVNVIKEVNNLSSDVLSVGQLLIIPTSLKPDIQEAYNVKSGDSFWSIAERYGITVEELKEENNLESNVLMPGTILVIPTRLNKDTITYVVREGDSLWSIASEYSMSVDDLKDLNNLEGSTLQVGDVLRIDSDSSSITYKVKDGDSLWSIANYYGMSVEELKALNKLDTNNITSGQELVVIKRKEAPEITTIRYTVKQGDSIWGIANRFGSTVEQIQQLNSLTSNNLQVGQLLIISKSVKPTDASIMVRVKRFSGVEVSVPLEEYVTGVVGSELSANFNNEAYKAQALAARTYAVKRLRKGEVISDTASHQVYKDKSQLKDWWGDEYEDIYKTIRLAVGKTEGEVITYNEQLIDALFFSTSNGRTENPSYVWGGKLPYLRSVDSSWDTKSPHYYDAKVLTYSQIRSRLGLSSSSTLYTNILSRTSGGSVDKINIAGKTFTGEEVRKRLALKSTDFDILFRDGKAKIQQRGWGHQVGLSQYGSHFMGEEGFSYKQIITHYYPGVSINQIIDCICK